MIFNGGPSILGAHCRYLSSFARLGPDKGTTPPRRRGTSSEARRHPLARCLSRGRQPPVGEPSGGREPPVEKLVQPVKKSGWWFGTFEVFFHIYIYIYILGMSSSQLTKSYCSEGLKPPTRNGSFDDENWEYLEHIWEWQFMRLYCVRWNRDNYSREMVTSPSDLWLFMVISQVNNCSLAN